MRIILLQDVRGIGQRGDLKTVKGGYARNYLLPKKLAKLATKESVKAIETQKAESQKNTEELKDTLKTIQLDTKKFPLSFKVKTGDKGEVFGSIMAEDIKAAIARKYPAIGNDHLEVKNNHIRELGKQEIDIDLGEGIEGEITINIEPESV